MKKCFCILFILIFFAGNAFAKSINAAAYQTMTAQSYRNNYRQVQNSRVMPYWQSQSNFSTRGRTYQNYSNYSRYMNNAYNSNYNSYRGYKW